MTKKILQGIAVVAMGVAISTISAAEDWSLEVMGHNNIVYAPPMINVEIFGAIDMDVYDGEGKRIIRRGETLYRETEDGSHEKVGYVIRSSVYGDMNLIALEPGEYIFKNIVFTNRTWHMFRVSFSGAAGETPNAEWAEDQNFEISYGLEFRIWADGSSEIIDGIPFYDISFQQSIGVAVDDMSFGFFSYGPVIVDGRTLVPAGIVFEALGLSVIWSSLNQMAYLANDELWLPFGQKTLDYITDDGQFAILMGIDRDTFVILTQESELVDLCFENYTHALDMPVQIINGRVMLPIRVIAEAVGFNVSWDEETRNVVITSPTKGEV